MRESEEIFFKYDKLRLRAFDNSPLQNKINICEDNSFTAFCFPEVDYFNYSILNDEKKITSKTLKNIQSFFAFQNISKHRVIINSEIAEQEQSILSKSGYKKQKTIVKLSYFHKNKNMLIPNVDIQFEIVTQKNISKYTAIYLDAFEATGRNINRVAENYKMLVNIEGLDSFIMKVENNPVGIAVLFNDSQNYFLAGGAVLKKFRNFGYHKAGLIMRINKCIKNFRIKNIISWAYKGGVSHQNMLKLNMEEKCYYDVLEFTKYNTQ